MNYAEIAIITGTCLIVVLLYIIKYFYQRDFQLQIKNIIKTFDSEGTVKQRKEQQIRPFGTKKIWLIVLLSIVGIVLTITIGLPDNMSLAVPASAGATILALGAWVLLRQEKKKLSYNRPEKKPLIRLLDWLDRRQAWFIIGAYTLILLGLIGMLVAEFLTAFFMDDVWIYSSFALSLVGLMLFGVGALRQSYKEKRNI